MDNSRIRNLLKHEPFMRYLHTAGLRQRKCLLKGASTGEIEVFCECFRNILKKNVQLTPEQLEILRQPEIRKLIYLLADRRVPISKKRAQLVKQAGGIPLGVLIPLITSLIGTAVS
jgi:hypothetical protein